MKPNFLLTFFLLTFPTFLMAGETVYKKLENIRDKINFRERTPEIKLSVIKGTRTYLQNVYVNYEHKIKAYNLDPEKELDLIVSKASTMSEVEFHDSMLRVFNSFKDEHNNYYMPFTYSCVDLILPFGLKKFGNKNVTVSSVSSGFGAIFEQLSEIGIGDEVIEYNGLSIVDYIKTRSPYLTGSTKDSEFLRGIEDLYSRPLKWNVLPQNNTQTIKFKKEDGETYSLNVPWIAAINVECFNITSVDKLEINESDRIDPERMIMQYDFEGTDAIDLRNMTQTSSYYLKYKKIEFNNKNIGYVRLTSFSDSKMKNDLFNEFKKTLDELSDTEALIIDLRGNGGGEIPIAERLAALINPNKSPALPFYTKSNSGMMNFYYAVRDVKWGRLASDRTKDGQVVGPLPMSDVEDIQQVYTKKVYLITSAECFSSCEVFAANVKDNSGAFIFGTDSTTFGGAANFFDNFLALGPLYNETIPRFFKGRITIRTAHRIKDHSIIDDVGVLSDRILSETKQEVIDKRFSMLLAEVLKSIAL